MLGDGDAETPADAAASERTAIHQCREETVFFAGECG